MTANTKIKIKPLPTKNIAVISIKKISKLQPPYPTMKKLLCNQILVCDYHAWIHATCRTPQNATPDVKKRALENINTKIDSSQ